MRLLSVFILIGVCFVCSSGGVGSESAADQSDISKSGKNFLTVCSEIGGQPNGDSIRVRNEATCLGWVEGFRDGFAVHDEGHGGARFHLGQAVTASDLRQVLLQRLLISGGALASDPRWTLATPPETPRRSPPLRGAALAGRF